MRSASGWGLFKFPHPAVNLQSIAKTETSQSGAQPNIRIQNPKMKLEGTPMRAPRLRGYKIRFREPMQHFGLAR